MTQPLGSAAIRASVASAFQKDDYIEDCMATAAMIMQTNMTHQPINNLSRTRDI